MKADELRDLLFTMSGATPTDSVITVDLTKTTSYCWGIYYKRELSENTVKKTKRWGVRLVASLKLSQAIWT